MKTIQTWLDEYAVCHQNPTNKKIHWICVPLIVWSLFALLWMVRLPFLEGLPVPANAATLVLAGFTVYYLLLSWQLAIGVLLLVSVMLGLGLQLSLATGVPMWILALVVFVAAWVGQFIGHNYEGKRPALFEDLRFLLIGPLWCLAHFYRKLGWKY